MLLRLPWGEDDEMSLNSAFISEVNINSEKETIIVNVKGEDIQYKIDFHKENIEAIKALYQQDVGFFAVNKVESYNNGTHSVFIGRKDSMISYNANKVIYKSATLDGKLLKMDVAESLQELDDIFVHGKQYIGLNKNKEVLRPVLLERKQSKYVY